MEKRTNQDEGVLVKRSDFFKGMWLSPLALVRGPKTPPNSSSTVDAQRDVALAELLDTTGSAFLAKSVLYNDAGEVIARGSGTFVKSKIPLTADMGYKL